MNKMTLDSNGNFGIGTVSPTGSITVSTTSGTSADVSSS
jgi:hypothetical protein